MKLKLAYLILTLSAIGLRVEPVGHGNSGSAAPAGDEAAILVGAGDIADCRDLSGAEATAKLLDHVSGTVMADGDLAYPDGTKVDADRA